MAGNFESPEQLLALMRAGQQEVYEIKLRNLTIPFRILSLDQRVDLRQRMMVENRTHQGDETSLSALIQKETLSLASTMSDQTTVLSPKLLSLMSMDEVIYLFMEYEKICEQVNPNLEVMKPEQFQALVDALKKNHIALNELSLPQLKAIALAYQDLIQRLDLERSQQDNVAGGQS